MTYPDDHSPPYGAVEPGAHRRDSRATPLRPSNADGPRSSEPSPPNGAGWPLRSRRGNSGRSRSGLAAFFEHAGMDAALWPAPTPPRCRYRCAKLTPDKLAALADLGLEWA